MTKAEIAAFNSGIVTVAALADASAAAMRDRLVEKPTRFNFAVEALEALVEASATLLLVIDKQTVDSKPTGLDAASDAI